MAFGNTFENDLVKLIFNGTAIANIADNASVSPLTNLYLSLHTANPTGSGNQTSSEAAYGGYARVAVARTSSGWSITNNVATLVAQATFPIALSGSETETYACIGTASSGTGKILAFAALAANIVVTTGVTPALTTGTTFTLT